jgi:hypothetical protein
MPRWIFANLCLVPTEGFKSLYFIVAFCVINVSVLRKNSTVMYIYLEMSHLAKLTGWCLSVVRYVCESCMCVDTRLSALYRCWICNPMRGSRTCVCTYLVGLIPAVVFSRFRSYSDLKSLPVILANFQLQNIQLNFEKISVICTLAVPCLMQKSSWAYELDYLLISCYLVLGLCGSMRD